MKKNASSISNDIKALISFEKKARAGVLRIPSFAQAELALLNIESAYLPGIDLEGANLKKANLAGANLVGANLQGAQLIGANLNGADLRNADLRNANLSQAQIDDVILTGAQLQGVNLQDVLGEPLSLTSAKIDQKTLSLSKAKPEFITELLERGAEVINPDSIPPSIRDLISSRPPSIIPIIRAAEVSTREIEHEAPGDPFLVESKSGTEKPISHSIKVFRDLNALIDDAQAELSAPVSILPQIPQVERLRNRQLVPTPGQKFLGINIDEELQPGTISKHYSGLLPSGKKGIVKAFNPGCDGAALQLSAFQRGVRGLKKLQSLPAKLRPIPRLLACALDDSAYLIASHSQDNLAHLLENKASFKEALDYFESLLLATERIHQEGLLVRAWKPANILLLRNRVLISEIDGVHLPTLKRYRTDLAGYAAYAAPEEIAGRGTRSPTADIFSLGKILEFLMTGEEPLSSLETERLLCQREQIPKIIVQMVLRATDTDPKHRYQNITAFAEDLTRFKKDGPSAQLALTVRPQATSILVTQPLSIRPRPLPTSVNKETEADAAREEKNLSINPPPFFWLSRRNEYLLAAMGLVAGICCVFAFTGAGASVERLESLAFAACCLVSLAVFTLPLPRKHVILVRLSSWVACATFFFLLGPERLMQNRWKHDLHGNNPIKKEHALKMLARLGHRDFQGLKLQNLKLTSLELNSANFSDSDLRGTNFQNCFLLESDFTHANLKRTTFLGANLKGSNFRSARHLHTSTCDRFTQLPSDLRCKRERIRRR